MNDKIANAVGLLRHRIISPVLVESSRNQMDYFRSISHQEFDVPGIGPRKFKAATMKGWLKKYRKHGFAGIIKRQRTDKGKHRRMTPEQWEKIILFRKQDLGLKVTAFYENCIREDLLGDRPVCMATVRLFLKQKGLFEGTEPKPRKRFEMSRFGELWTGDFMHAIQVIDGKRQRKSVLFAIIDDHSRVIVGSRFGFGETTMPVEWVFKDAITTFGLCDRLYVDNGSAFSSHYLANVCARLGVGLVHSKPYDSPSRGKIERFFRTVRDDFLACKIRPNEQIRVEELNDRFGLWLRDDYHHQLHRGVNARPIDVYQASVTSYPPKRIDVDILDELFMVSFERTVNNDATVSYESIIYEVPSRYIGKRIELRHTQGNSSNIYIYEDNLRVVKIAAVDTKYNGSHYRPQTEPHISLTGPKGVLP